MPVIVSSPSVMTRLAESSPVVSVTVIPAPVAKASVASFDAASVSGLSTLLTAPAALVLLKSA